MKILFLCGSLAPGKDGVGDYTRRLATALISMKHEAIIIALNDPDIVEEVKENQAEGESNVSVMRLPAVYPWPLKLQIAKQYTTQQNPDWISVQYVPFAFHHKGLPYRFSAFIKEMAIGRKLHIMFHELWTGMKRGTSLKELLLGILQKGLIFSMVRSLSPTVIHTQSNIYLEQLKKRGIKAQYLPLFGNIAVVPEIQKRKTDDNIQLVFFGGIHPEAPIQDFVDKLSSYIRVTKKKVVVNFIGRNGFWLNTWLTAFSKIKISVNVLGEQPPEIISRLLQQSDAGLFTTPARLAEKSGSVAAMLEHGLPVICVQKTWVARGLKPIETQLPVYEFDKIDFHQLFNSKLIPQSGIGLSSVATQFINSLTL